MGQEQRGKQISPPPADQRVVVVGHSLNLPGGVGQLGEHAAACIAAGVRGLYFESSFYALDASAVLKSRSLGLTGSIDDATTKEKMRHGIVGHSAGQTSQKSHSA